MCLLIFRAIGRPRAIMTRCFPRCASKNDDVISPNASLLSGSLSSNSDLGVRLAFDTRSVASMPALRNLRTTTRTVLLNRKEVVVVAQNGRWEPMSMSP